MLNLLQEEQQESYLISTDKSKIDIDAVFSYISGESYWAKDIPKDTLQKSIDHSLCFGVYYLNNNSPVQIGFARVISDYATFAYLADVYILEPHRGKGLSKWLMKFILKHPELQGLRRFSLATRDAHSLYTQFGFKNADKPENLMEIKDPDIYAKHKK